MTVGYSVPSSLHIFRTYWEAELLCRAGSKPVEVEKTDEKEWSSLGWNISGQPYDSAKGLKPPTSFRGGVFPGRSIVIGARMGGVNSWHFRFKSGLDSPSFRTYEEAVRYAGEVEGRLFSSSDAPMHDLRWEEGGQKMRSTDGSVPPKGVDFIVGAISEPQEVRSWGTPPLGSDVTFKTKAEAEFYLRALGSPYTPVASTSEPNQEIIWNEDGVDYASGEGLLPKEGYSVGRGNLKTSRPLARKLVASWQVAYEDEKANWGNLCFATKAEADFWASKGQVVKPSELTHTRCMLWTVDGVDYKSGEGLLPPKGVTYAAYTSTVKAFSKLPTSWCVNDKYFATKWEADLWGYSTGGAVTPSMEPKVHSLGWHFENQWYDSVKGLKPPEGWNTVWVGKEVPATAITRWDHSYPQRMLDHCKPKEEKMVSWSVQRRFPSGSTDSLECLFFKTEAEAVAFRDFWIGSDTGRTADVNPSKHEAKHEVFWEKGDVIYGSGEGLPIPTAIIAGFSSLSAKTQRIEVIRSWETYDFYSPEVGLRRFKTKEEAATQKGKSVTFRESHLAPTHALTWTTGNQSYVSTGSLKAPKGATPIPISDITEDFFSETPQSWVVKSTPALKYRTREEAEWAAEADEDVGPSEGAPNTSLGWTIAGRVYDSEGGLLPPEGFTGDIEKGPFVVEGACTAKSAQSEMNDQWGASVLPKQSWGVTWGTKRNWYYFKTEAEALTFSENKNGPEVAHSHRVADSELRWVVDGTCYGSSEGLLPPPGASFPRGSEETPHSLTSEGNVVRTSPVTIVEVPLSEAAKEELAEAIQKEDLQGPFHEYDIESLAIKDGIGYFEYGDTGFWKMHLSKAEEAFLRRVAVVKSEPDATRDWDRTGEAGYELDLKHTYREFEVDLRIEFFDDDQEEHALLLSSLIKPDEAPEEESNHFPGILGVFGAAASLAFLAGGKGAAKARVGVSKKETEEALEEEPIVSEKLLER